jgi:hypothetical protein
MREAELSVRKKKNGDQEEGLARARNRLAWRLSRLKWRLSRLQPSLALNGISLCCPA